MVLPPGTVISSPLRAEVFAVRVRGHPRISKDLQDYTIGGVRDGHHTGYEGPEVSYAHNNLKSCEANLAAALETVDEEISLGRFVDVTGRPPHPYACVQAIGMTGKKSLEIDDSGKPILRWRLFTHLSKSGAYGSTNDGIIGDNSLTYTVIMDIGVDVMRFAATSTDVCLTAFDFKSAFRHLKRHPSLLHLALLSITDSTGNTRRVADCFLDFGGRSTPKIWDSLMLVLLELLRDDLAAAGLVECVDYSLRHLLDDCTAICKTTAIGHRVFKIGIALFKELGLAVQELKSVNAERSATCLGYEVDCERLTLSLPVDKAASYVELADFVLAKAPDGRRKRVRRDIIETLCGKFGFAHSTNPFARAWINPLYRHIHQLTKPHLTTTISPEARRAIGVFRNYISDAPKFPLEWMRPKPVFGLREARDPFDYERASDWHVCGDASGIRGFGFYTSHPTRGGYYSCRLWVASDGVGMQSRAEGASAASTARVADLDTDASSTLLETICLAHAVATAIDNGARNCRLVYYGDNLGVVAGGYKRRSKTPAINSIWRSINFMCARACVLTVCVWRERTCPWQKLADDLSRCDVTANTQAQLSKLAPGATRQVTPSSVPTEQTASSLLSWRSTSWLA